MAGDLEGGESSRAPSAWSPRALVGRITHIGVDSTLPRHETKHVVLTNQYALFIIVCLGASLAMPSAATLLPEVRAWLLAGLLGTPLALVLNARRHHTVASTWLLCWFMVVMFAVARLEPLATEHIGFFLLTAVVAWFVFPASRRAVATVVAALSVVAGVGLFWWLRTYSTPSQLPGFDVDGIGLGNTIIAFLAVIFFCVRTASEMTRVERELMAERQRSETLLRREVAHQVAERSRELGAALSRPDGPATPSSSSTRFGARYQIVRSLGEGGMGAVFEVERRTDAQRLALKVMTGPVSREHAARFAREAEIGARLDDPHLVSIVDVGVAEGGAPFLVMELVMGGSLEQRRSRFGDLAWALPILRQVARGLAVLHEAGVVHRDLKPANVLLDEHGAAKVSDFGIARFGPIRAEVDPSGPTAVAPSPSPHELTRTGVWIGTPSYMAPETARGGRDALASADMFAFGILAYELVTGGSPFATPPVLLALAGQPIPPPASLEASGLPPAARDAIHACLAEDPARRPDARGVLAALGDT